MPRARFEPDSPGRKRARAPSPETPRRSRRLSGPPESPAIARHAAAAKAAARAAYGSGDFLAAARLFRAIGERATGAAASNERANEAAALLAAAVADPGEREVYGRAALAATEAALAADSRNFRAVLRRGKAHVLLGDLRAARAELERLFDAPCDDALKREAVEAHDRLSARSPPSTRQRRTRAARHLAALGLGPTCATPDVKTARRRLRGASAAARGADDAYAVLLPTASRARYLWSFAVIGEKIDLGPDLGPAVVLDFDEPTATHHVQFARTGERTRLTLEPPESPPQTRKKKPPPPSPRRKSPPPPG